MRTEYCQLLTVQRKIININARMPTSLLVLPSKPIIDWFAVEAVWHCLLLSKIVLDERSWLWDQILVIQRPVDSGSPKFLILHGVFVRRKFFGLYRFWYVAKQQTCWKNAWHIPKHKICFTDIVHQFMTALTIRQTYRHSRGAVSQNV